MKRLVLGGLSAMMMGCAAQGSSVRVELAKATAEIREMRRLQAEQTAELAEVRNDIRSVSGRLDEIEYTAREKIGNLARLKDDLTNINRRLPPPAIVPTAELEADEALVSRLPAEVAGPFSQSLQSLRAGKFEEAEAQLQQALDLGYSEQCGANIVFWQGVVSEARGDDRRALASYSEVLSRYPRNDRAGQALLRQGLLFARVGDKKAAQVTFKKLMAEYPKSRAAEQAKQKMKEL